MTGFGVGFVLWYFGDSHLMEHWKYLFSYRFDILFIRGTFMQISSGGQEGCVECLNQTAQFIS